MADDPVDQVFAHNEALDADERKAKPWVPHFGTKPEPPPFVFDPFGPPDFTPASGDGKMG